jgi:hypothetical protein
MGDKNTITFYMTGEEIRRHLELCAEVIERDRIKTYTSMCEDFMKGYLELGYSRAVAGKMAADSVNAILPTLNV